MFTGIVEEVGRLRRVTRQGQALVVTVEASRTLEDVHLGDSIAVNGVCLTVVAFDGSTFTADVMPETFRKTTLRYEQPGAKLNLERAIAANGRFGGHFVQGHVDTEATIAARTVNDNAVVFRFEPAEVGNLKYVIRHGSIAVDGISLTVVDVGERFFTVSVIPHTLAQTALNDKKPGDRVNIEYDLLGKYMDRLLQFRGKPGEEAEGGQDSRSGVTLDLLAKHGFM